MKLEQLARDTIELIGNGSYEVNQERVDFSAAQAEAFTGTRLYTPSDLDQIHLLASDQQSAVEVVEGTTQQVAQTLSQKVPDSSRIGLLNFASARNPGGGFLSGAKAQEEDLCRCSGLYPCLLKCMEYYKANRRQSSLLYTDHMIFSPSVPFFKTKGTGALLEEPFYASIITAPAPNSGPFLQRNSDGQAEIEATFLRRWRSVLKIAKHNQLTHLLLGAWGCGAFQGDPSLAARTAKESILTDGLGLKKIMFAIPGTGKQSKANLAAFRSTFG